MIQRVTGTSTDICLRIARKFVARSAVVVDEMTSRRLYGFVIWVCSDGYSSCNA